MDRIHLPMSWNEPTQSGQSDSETENDPSNYSPFGAGEGKTWNSYYTSEISDDGSSEHEFSIEGNSCSHPTSHRTYFLPLHYTPTYDYPLIVWLHSNGFNENQVDHVMPHVSLRNYVGVGIRGNRAADAVGHRFDWHQSPAGIGSAHEAVVQAIEEAADRFSVNPTRVIVAGYRQGGTMALRIAMREPSRIAGAISIGGRMPQGALGNLQQLRKRRLPMLWQWAHANADYTEGNLKTDCQAVMAIGSPVEVRQYPTFDEMDTVVLRDVDDWIMRRIISTSTSSADSDRWVTSPTAYSSN